MAAKLAYLGGRRGGEREVRERMEWRKMFWTKREKRYWTGKFWRNSPVFWMRRRKRMGKTEGGKKEEGQEERVVVGAKGGRGAAR